MRKLASRMSVTRLGPEGINTKTRLGLYHDIDVNWIRYPTSRGDSDREDAVTYHRLAQFWRRVASLRFACTLISRALGALSAGTMATSYPWLSKYPLMPRRADTVDVAIRYGKYNFSRVKKRGMIHHRIWAAVSLLLVKRSAAAWFRRSTNGNDSINFSERHPNGITPA